MFKNGMNGAINPGKIDIPIPSFLLKFSKPINATFVFLSIGYIQQPP